MDWIAYPAVNHYQSSFSQDFSRVNLSCCLGGRNYQKDENAVLTCNRKYDFVNQWIFIGRRKLNKAPAATCKVLAVRLMPKVFVCPRLQGE
jgi:hypothetical protein